MRINDLIRIGAHESAVEEALAAPDATPTDVLVQAWYESRTKLRSSPEFGRFVRSSRLLAYWQENGWPDLCRPVGNDDFECR